MSGRPVTPKSNGKVVCSAYECRLPTGLAGSDFVIRFLSPDQEPGPREFYIEPVLCTWMGDGPSDFLEKACAEGARILAPLEKGTSLDDAPYAAFQALFRNRNAGQAGIKRRFNCAADFLDCPPDRPPQLIAPGFDSEGPQYCHGPHKIANELLGRALSQHGNISLGSHPRLKDVIAYYEAITGVQVQKLSANQASPTWYGPGPEMPQIDLLFTECAVRSTPFDQNQVVRAVRPALVYGPMDWEERLTAAQRTTPAALKHQRLVAVALGKVRLAVAKRNPGEFDRWLKNVREHQYLSLLDGVRLKGPAKEEAARQAECVYTDLLWLSYRMMARCYGMLMLAVWINFSLSSDLAPDERERWLFRQRHFPQLFLAGLPVDFLGYAQYPWIHRSFRGLLREGIRQAEPYDCLWQMLNFYSLLVARRRETDRERKRGSSLETMVTSRAVEDTSDSDDWEYISGKGLADLTSTTCPRCGSKLIPLKVVEELDATHVRARFDCPECGERDYRVDHVALVQKQPTR